MPLSDFEWAVEADHRLLCNWSEYRHAHFLLCRLQSSHCPASVTLSHASSVSLSRWYIMTFIPLRPRAILSGTAILSVASAGVYWTLLSQTAHAESKEPPMTFAGWFGVSTLRLHSVKVVNHNTKRFIFELPEKDARSGLTLTCP